MASLQYEPITLNATLDRVSAAMAVVVRHVPTRPWFVNGKWLRLLPGMKRPGNRFAIAADVSQSRDSWHAEYRDPAAIVFHLIDGGDGSTVIEWECSYEELLPYVAIVEEAIERWVSKAAPRMGYAGRSVVVQPPSESLPEKFSDDYYQQRTYEMLRDGKTARDISLELGIGESAVNKRKTKIYEAYPELVKRPDIRRKRLSSSG